MNNQSLILLAIGTFVALIVTVAAVDQYFLDEQPPTEVEGLMWRVENAFNRVQDLEATLQVSNEEHPAENIRMKLRYVKGPPTVLSMRYVPPQDVVADSFVEAVRDETFTIENDQLFHYIPSEDIVVSKRWPGVPLAAIGLGIFDITQLRSDWASGKTQVEIRQDMSGFTELPYTSAVSVAGSLSDTPSIPSAFFSALQELQSPQSDGLRFSFSPETREDVPPLTAAQVFDADATGSIAGNYILEVRDPSSKDLLRMIWIDRETYLIQKVVTFKNGQRNATLLIQLLTVDQGLTEGEVITSPQAAVENIRG